MKLSVAAPFAIVLTSVLAGCAGTGFGGHSTPSAIAVPAGNEADMRLSGIGEVLYECRVKAGGFQWSPMSPNATLYDRNRAVVGKYTGGPTWTLNDGSKLTGRQVAKAPAPGGSIIPWQLLKTAASVGKGKLNGVTYIQRLNTSGGEAPDMPCSDANAGQRHPVQYRADYVFFKPI
jgi:hypothetical protein